MMTNVFNSLILMGKGMTAIFVVIGIIYVIVTILIKMMPQNNKES